MKKRRDGSRNISAVPVRRMVDDIGEHEVEEKEEEKER